MFIDMMKNTKQIQWGGSCHGLVLSSLPFLKYVPQESSLSYMEKDLNQRQKAYREYVCSIRNKEEEEIGEKMCLGGDGT